ncbi:hypothetical protein ACJX0J_027556, partial [Zea mays]
AYQEQDYKNDVGYTIHHHATHSADSNPFPLQLFKGHEDNRNCNTCHEKGENEDCAQAKPGNREGYLYNRPHGHTIGPDPCHDYQMKNG